MLSLTKISVAPEARAEGRIGAHLQPVIDFLAERGNPPLSKGFVRDKTGVCRFFFHKPLDVALLKRCFLFPDSIRLGDYPLYGGGALFDLKHALVLQQVRE